MLLDLDKVWSSALRGRVVTGLLGPKRKSRAGARVGHKPLEEFRV
jgi:hypothetical protein